MQYTVRLRDRADREKVFTATKTELRKAAKRLKGTRGHGILLTAEINGRPLTLTEQLELTL